MLLRYVPPLKSGLKILVFISFFIVALVLYVAFIQWGFAAFLVFSFFYAAFMLITFISLSKKHYIAIDEDKGIVTIQKFLRKIELSVEDINMIDLKELKNSYVLTIHTEKEQQEYNLSGSLSFEEPPFAPFLRRMQKLKPTVRFGDYCINVLQGKSTFNPWSTKMYYTYWSYVLIMVAYYLLLLLFLNLLK